MIIKQQHLGMAFCKFSHHTANQRATDLPYYFSIGYYYHWVLFILSQLVRVSR